MARKWPIVKLVRRRGFYAPGRLRLDVEECRDEAETYIPSASVTGLVKAVEQAIEKLEGDPRNFGQREPKLIAEMLRDELAGLRAENN